MSDPIFKVDVGAGSGRVGAGPPGATRLVYYIQSKILGTVRATDISENVGGIALPAYSSTLSLYEYTYNTYSFSDYINDFGQEDFSVFEIVRGLLDSGEAGH